MIGIDIVDVGRVEEILTRHKERFLRRIATEEERVYLKEHSHPRHVAGLYAAKEAMAKAEGSGIGVLSFQDIHLLRHESGALEGWVKGEFYEVSLSHEGGVAVAVARRRDERLLHHPYRQELLHRPRNLHKYSAGAVMIRAGRRHMLGAARYATLAALKSGAGIVFLVVSEEAMDAASILIPEAVLLTHEEAKKSLSKCSAFGFGPGMGREEKDEELLREALLTKKPLLLDADALSLAKGMDHLIHEKVGLTPHLGEARKFLVEEGEERLSEKAKEWTKKTCGHLLLKGEENHLFSQGEDLVFSPGSPALATAGSGDVLFGMVLGLLDVYPMEKALEVAARLHGLLGKTFEREGHLRSSTAEDLLQGISRLF